MACMNRTDSCAHILICAAHSICRGARESAHLHLAVVESTSRNRKTLQGPRNRLPDPTPAGAMACTYHTDSCAHIRIQGAQGMYRGARESAHSHLAALESTTRDHETRQGSRNRLPDPTPAGAMACAYHDGPGANNRIHGAQGMYRCARESEHSHLGALESTTRDREAWQEARFRLNW